MEYQQECPFSDGTYLAGQLADEAVVRIMNQNVPKLNAIWLELTGCSGNIISFLNGVNPNAYEVFTQLVNLTYSNSVMGPEGAPAFERFIETLDTEFILLADGAVSMKDNGAYNIVAYYQGRRVTSYEAALMAAEKAKYMIAVGTCASYGGISAASPNPAGCVSLSEAVNRSVIRLPTCPCHPDWVIGTVAHLAAFGMPELDSEGRPVLFYGRTIHDTCTRRGLFDSGIFATKYGEEGCMFNIGCKGPITSTECPRRKWNGYVNWPIGNNTTCIGCGHADFPDGTEPFVKY